MKVYQKFWNNDKGDKNPTPKLGYQHDNLKGNETNPSRKNGEKYLFMH
jgi:hypothetical protein